MTPVFNQDFGDFSFLLEIFLCKLTGRIVTRVANMFMTFDLEISLWEIKLKESKGRE